MVLFGEAFVEVLVGGEDGLFADDEVLGAREEGPFLGVLEGGGEGGRGRHGVGGEGGGKGRRGLREQGLLADSLLYHVGKG